MLDLIESGVDDDPSVQLPRTQAGSQPQHLLLTLLGDYFLDSSEYIPSASLVSLLEEFGITSAGSRAALSRLSRRGLLASSKTGRNTYYRLTPRAAEFLQEGAQHILSFGAAERPWSGSWTIVAFSVPEEQRQPRGRRIDVVGRLAHVDVIVGMHGLLAAHGFAGEL